MHVYSNIKRFRALHNYTQAYVGDKLGLHQKDYSNIETRKRKITPEQLAILAELYNCSVDAFYQEPDQPLKQNQVTEKERELYEALLSEKDRTIQILQQLNELKAKPKPKPKPKSKRKRK